MRLTSGGSDRTVSETLRRWISTGGVAAKTVVVVWREKRTASTAIATAAAMPAPAASQRRVVLRPASAA